jgi:alkylation response protein AidB-like acyl-CoA dehydrogenase
VSDDDTTVDMDAFRAEVREFVPEHLPATAREKVRLGVATDKSDILGWLARLRDRGWLVPNWPQRWGGPGWTPAQRAVFADELALNHAPEGAGISFEMVGPILIHHGSRRPSCATGASSSPATCWTRRSCCGPSASARWTG